MQHDAYDSTALWRTCKEGGAEFVASICMCMPVAGWKQLSRINWSCFSAQRTRGGAHKKQSAARHSIIIAASIHQAQAHHSRSTLLKNSLSKSQTVSGQMITMTDGEIYYEVNVGAVQHER